MKSEMENKKPYQAPELTLWGSIEALTAGDLVSGVDADENADPDVS